MKTKLFLLLMLISNIGFAQSTKTLITTHKPVRDTVTVQLENLTVHYWNSPNIRFIVSVESNLPERALGSLVTSGRYAIQSETSDSQLFLMPGRTRTVKYNDEEITEFIKVDCYIPEYIVLDGLLK